MNNNQTSVPQHRPTYSQAKRSYATTVSYAKTQISMIYPKIKWEKAPVVDVGSCDEIENGISLDYGAAGRGPTVKSRYPAVISAVNAVAKKNGYGNEATIVSNNTEHYEAWYGPFDQELRLELSHDLVIITISGGCYPDPEGAAFTHGPSST